jgi:hypothetical protein
LVCIELLIVCGVGAHIAAIAHAVSIRIGLVSIGNLRAVVAAALGYCAGFRLAERLFEDALAYAIAIGICPASDRLSFVGQEVVAVFASRAAVVICVIIAGISEAVFVEVGLFSVKRVEAAVAGIAHAILVEVLLIVIGYLWAVVAGVAKEVVIAVFLARVVVEGAVVIVGGELIVVVLFDIGEGDARRNHAVRAGGVALGEEEDQLIDFIDDQANVAGHIVECNRLSLRAMNAA